MYKVSHAVNRARPHHVCSIYRNVLRLYRSPCHRRHRWHRWRFYRRRRRPAITLGLTTDPPSRFGVTSGHLGAVRAHFRAGFGFRHRCGSRPAAVTTRRGLRDASKTNLRGDIEEVGGRSLFGGGRKVAHPDKKEGAFPTRNTRCCNIWNSIVAVLQ